MQSNQQSSDDKKLSFRTDIHQKCCAEEADSQISMKELSVFFNQDSNDAKKLSFQT